MNLENLGVQEMNAQEVKSVDGGNDFTDGVNAGTGAFGVGNRKGFWYWFGYGIGKTISQ